MFLIYYFLGLIGIFTSLIVVHICVLFILSRLKKYKPNDYKNFYKTYSFLIPAFREGKILLNTIDAIKKLNYDKSKFEIFLIADDCDPNILKNLEGKCKIIQINFTEHSKAKSLQAAISEVKDKFDYVVILDADNLPHPNFLLEIDKTASKNIEVIQGKRVAKNKDNIYSKTDSLTESFYNILDRKIPNSLGLPVTLSGSGFAIKTKLFCNYILQVNVIGGFDKVFQSVLVKNNIKLVYNENAIIYDEKISNKQAYIRQRSRWIYFNFYNAFNYGLQILGIGLLGLDFTKIHFAIVSLRPPLILFSSVLVVFSVFSFLFSPFIGVFFFSQFILLILVTLFILFETEDFSFDIIKNFPRILVNQFYSLVKIKNSKFDSKNTLHLVDETIDEIISKRNE